MPASLSFCPVLDELYSKQGAVDATGIHRAAGGLSTPNNVLLLRALMMKLKPKRTLEVGLASGGSALTFTASHRDLGAQPSQQHTAIDPYQRVWHDLGKTLVARAGLDPYFRVLEEPSCLAMPSLMRAGEKFQLIYIDGSHAYIEAMLDFYYARHLLDVGGVVVFDDCATDDVGRLMTFIRKHIRSHKEFDLTPYTGAESFKHRLAHAVGKSQCVAFRKVSDPENDENWQWK